MIVPIILASLVSTGVFVCTREEMILFPLVKAYDKVQYMVSGGLLKFIRKPLFDCLYCQGSVYGALAYIISTRSISWEIVPVMFAVCGLNSVIAEIIRKLWDKEPCRNQKRKC